MSTRAAGRVASGTRTGVQPKNDLSLYDELAATWWEPRGPLAMLHWIAAARADLIPPAGRSGAVLLDIGCGAGLLGPHVSGKGYHHVGIDLSQRALGIAASHDVTAVRGDAQGLPLADEVADVVSLGEVLEHVGDLGSTVAEACRVLRPGGVLVLDTIASTALARLIVVTIAERVPGGAPPGIHDPDLFVDRLELVALCELHGVELALSGLRPAFPAMLSWRLGKRSSVPMVRTWSTSVLFQGVGVKRR